jgi:monoamine oxidase
LNRLLLTAGTLWDDIYDGVYFSATEWRTIDKGLNRLAEAFHPIVDSRLEYGRRIERLTYNDTTGKTGVAWREAGEIKTETYDKTLVAVPFSVARLWRTPTLGPIITEAIKGLGYSYACKVSVSFESPVKADRSCSTGPVSGNTLTILFMAAAAPPTFPALAPSATPRTTSMVPVLVHC